jgi:S1-C subfamily serine protease
MKRILFLFFSLGTSLFLVASCAAPPREAVAVRTLEEITSQEIQRLIDENQPGKALQWVRGLQDRKSQLLSAEDLVRLSTESKSKMLQLFENSIQEKNFSKAMTQYISLSSAGAIPENFSWNRDSLLFMRSETHREKGESVLSLNFFLQINDYSNVKVEDLFTYAGISIQANNLNALERIRNLLETQNRNLPPEFAEAGKKTLSPADLMVGAVTIWVNRGIRIEKGIGLPDRVIGSGFFIDPRGYLLTNYHVIESEVDPTYEGYSRLFIRPSNRSDEKIPARVIGYDKIFDVALLKVELQPPFVFGISNIQDLQPGTRIFAIGSPGGLDNTITSGIVSATGRRFFQMGDAMQMDVPVNPGSSGGPLVDEAGRFIGIVFAGIEQFEGVNFAIPGYWIRKFLPKLYGEGAVVHSWIGLGVHENRKELEVTYVSPGSPAHEIGMLPGDRIIKILDRSVQSIRDAHDILLSLEPETLISLTFTRGENERTSLVYLQKRPYSPLEKSIEFEARENLFPPLFGFSARPLTSGFFSEDFIVEKVYSGSIADESSISENDPFSVRRWVVDKKRRSVIMQMVIKKRKAGFLEGGVQIGAFFEQNNFI